MITSSIIGRPYTVAVLPIPCYEGHLTPCSEYIAESLLKAFIDTPATVLDRQSLESVLTELDLDSAFDNPSQVPRITRADCLILGRYIIAEGTLHLDLKATEVSTNRLLNAYTATWPLDSYLRRILYSRPSESRGAPGYQIWEQGGKTRIRAMYTEQGRNQFYLLDRVRQIIRKGLADYLRNGLGMNLSDAEIEKRFRFGVEVHCEFETGTVTLEMEFGGPT